MGASTFTVSFTLRFPDVDFSVLEVAGELVDVAAEARAAWAAAAGVDEDQVQVTLSQGSLVMEVGIRGIDEEAAAEAVVTAVMDKTLVADSILASPLLLNRLDVDPGATSSASLDVNSLFNIESAPVVTAVAEPGAGADAKFGTDGGGPPNALVYGSLGGAAALVVLLVLALYVRRKRVAGKDAIEFDFYNGGVATGKRLLGKPPGAATEMMARTARTRQAAYKIANDGEESSLFKMFGVPSNGVEGRLGAQSVMVNPLSVANTRPPADSTADGLWLDAFDEGETTAFNPLSASAATTDDSNAHADADFSRDFHF